MARPLTSTAVPAGPSGFGARLGAAAQAFVSTFFGPGIPPAPTADTQKEGPRGWQFGTNYNQAYTPRGSEGLTPFQTLINIAQLYDTAAACIRYRVEELSTMEWDVVDVDKAKPASESEKADYRAVLERPDGQMLFEDWIAEMVEEILVTDALSVYLPKSRRGEVLGFELIAGDTIRTLADAHGRTPKSPTAAYQQIIYGRPAWEGSTEDMLYMPKTRRTRSLYGRSPTEEMVLLINRALRRQVHDLNWYAESNIPEALVPIPDLPPEQIATLQDWLDNIVAQPEQRRRLHMIPSTTGRLTPFQFKQPILDTEVELFLDKRAMAFYGVPAQNLGFSDANRAAGALQENVAFLRQQALVKFVGRVIRQLMRQRGFKNCQILLHGEQPEEDKLRQAQVDKIYVDMGKMTIDELRQRDGESPLGITEPFVVTPNGPVYLKQSLEQQVAMGKAALDQAKNPQTGGPEGVAGGQGHGGGGDAQKTDDGQPIDGKPTQTGGEGKFGDGLSRAEGRIQVAGLAVLAADTGRVLMIQRANMNDDPAAGTWEFPGGHIEDGEQPRDAAIREWQEETGHSLPVGGMTGTWTSPNGVYQGFVYQIASESDVRLNLDHEDRHVLNPDDPDGDQIEVIAWWDPNQIPRNPAVRQELRRGTDRTVFTVKDAYADASTIQRELRAWQAYATKRGTRPVRPFAPTRIPEPMATEIRRRLDEGEEPKVVFADARASLQVKRADPPKKRRPEEYADDEESPPASPKQQHRDRILLPLAGAVGASVLSAVSPSQPGTASDAESTLRNALTRSYEAGLRVAGVDRDLTASDTAYIERVVSEQLPYLQNFIGQIGDMTEDAIAARANLYGEPLFGAYSRGLVTGGQESGVESWTWNAVMDDGTCELCAPRDGQAFTADELDEIGYPGENNFSDGPDGCQGACRCVISPSEPE